MVDFKSKKKWKPKPWVQYVLPGLLVTMGVLILLAIIVDEFTFLTCGDVRQTLLDTHGSLNRVGIDEETHLKYHEYYDKCLSDGAYQGMDDEGI